MSVSESVSVWDLESDSVSDSVSDSESDSESESESESEWVSALELDSLNADPPKCRRRLLVLGAVGRHRSDRRP